MTTVYGNPDANHLLIQLVDDHDLQGMASEIAEIRRLTETDFCLLAMKVPSWMDDLSPWPAPAVFGQEGFGGRAEATFVQVLKHAGEYTADKPRACILGGYSLAGLFALWAACRTDAFDAVAAASPSVWFPGFTDYLRENAVRARSVYLSLGDREEKTRNPVMATVGDRIREVYGLLRAQGVSAALEWNPGNHFRDADKRTARAFAWAMRH